MAEVSDRGVTPERSGPLRFHLVTIFPNFFDSLLSYGVVSRALRQGRASASVVDLRSFTSNRHRTVDDRPFGGGEGMVMKPEPLAAAVESLGIAPKHQRDAQRETVILLSAQGKPFRQATAHKLARMERVVLVCGRYEGVDERFTEMFCDRELSVGDYVLSGGELGAAIVMDAAIRLLPGVLGNADSAHYESFGLAGDTAMQSDGPPLAVAASAGLLDYPHYTRPAEFRGVAIPEVLAGGDHLAIRRWRRQQSLRKTWSNRPDLFQNAPLTADDERYLRSLRQTQSKDAQD